MTRNLAWAVACTAALVACGGGTEQHEPPLAPANLEATPGDGVVGLRWDAAAGAEGYTVYWSTAPGLTTASGTAIRTQATTLNHAGLDNGVTYHYVVTAANGAGESPESAEVSATPVPAYQPLTVARAGTGGGSVVSAPPGIDCGSACAASLDRGSSVTLTATPDATSTFDGWSGDCTGAGDCALVMDDARSATATFTRITHVLTVVRGGTGGGTVTSAPAGIDCGSTCEATFDAGTQVTLTAAPDATSSFAGWSGACTGTGDCTVSVERAETAIATFTRFTRALSVTRAGTGGGTVTSAPAGIDCGSTCEAAYDIGTVVELTAATDATSTFAGWDGGSCAGTGRCTVTMDQARSVTATFTRITYALTTNVSPGGTVTSAPARIDCLPTCSASYDAGTPVTLTVHPANGAVFMGWCLDCSGTNLTCTVTMDADRSVCAAFAYPITVSKAGTGGGTVTSGGLINCGTTCYATASPGTTLTLTATSDATSVFAGWSGDCTGTGTCTVQLSAARSVIATFTRRYVLTVTTTDGGTVTTAPAGIDCGATCQATYDAETPVTLTATPAPGATFAGWTGGVCTGTGSCIVTMDSAKSVSAVFTYPLTITKSGGGAGTVSSSPAGISCGSTCTAGFYGGTLVTLTASPDASSAFEGWSGACSGTGACQVSMDQVRSVDAKFASRPVIVTTTVRVVMSGPTPQWFAVPLVVRDGDPGQSLTLSRAGGYCPGTAPLDLRGLPVSFDSGDGAPVSVPDALEILVGSGYVGYLSICLTISDGVLESTKRVPVSVEAPPP